MSLGKDMGHGQQIKLQTGRRVRLERLYILGLNPVPGDDRRGPWRFSGLALAGFEPPIGYYTNRAIGGDIVEIGEQAGIRAICHDPDIDKSMTGDFDSGNKWPGRE